MRILGPGIQRRAYCLGLLPRALPRQKVFGAGEHFLWSSQHILGGEVLHLNERWAFLLVFNLGETLGFCGSFGQRASMHELTTPGRHSFLRLLAEILCGTLPLPLPPSLCFRPETVSLLWAVLGQRSRKEADSGFGVGQVPAHKPHLFLSPSTHRWASW